MPAIALTTAWRWCALALLLWVGALDARTIKLNGLDYTSLDSFGSSFGLRRTWTEPGKQLRLKSQWTTVDFEVDSREVHINGLRVFLGDATVLSGGRLHVSRVDEVALLGPILSPRRAGRPVPQLRTIVLDAGHGGRDSGTRHPQKELLEKTYTLDLAQRLGQRLEAAGYRVVQTRTDDTFIPLPERAAIANRARADLFVSLHFNAINQPGISGAETYVLTPATQRSTGSDRAAPADVVAVPGNAFDAWNAIVGYRVHRRLISELGAFDRGLKRARFAVLRDLECPGVLVEGGYLTNDAEAKRIASPEWRERLAQAIFQGIQSYGEALDTARRH